MIDPGRLREEVDSFPWYHSIDLGGGVTTKGQSVMAEMLNEAQLPDVRGRSVLDIGAWDGYYSFLAERLGASRVVALDHYVWGVDFGARTQYWNECLERGELPDHTRDTTDFWHDDLPGRRGFDLAHRVLGSRVEPVVGDFATMDLSTLGTFDVVFYFGVLYHMKEPLTCLERLRAVTREVAVIETVAAQVPGNATRSLLELHAGGELNADYGNWYVPTIEALRALSRAAGYAASTSCAGLPSCVHAGASRAGCTWCRAIGPIPPRRTTERSSRRTRSGASRPHSRPRRSTAAWRTCQSRSVSASRRRASTASPSKAASASTARRRTAGRSSHAASTTGSVPASPIAPSAATAASRTSGSS